MNAKELYHFIVEHQEDYETCIHAIQSEFLAKQIRGLAGSSGEYERIDKEHPTIRLTTAQEAIEGNKCCSTNKRCGCSST